MEGNTPEQEGSALIVANEDKMLEKHEVKEAAALLLTRAPMESLRDQLDRISAVGPHFYAVNMNVRQRLRKDAEANRLRRTLMRLNVPMNSASERMNLFFLAAQAFYVHNRDEFIPVEHGPGPVTQEQTATLLQAEFQERAVERAREVAASAAKASQLVREKVLPLLPSLKTELDHYVASYIKRVSDNERRERSYFWSTYDLVFGRSDPILVDVEIVEGLPQHLSTGGDLLRLLPAFLDNMELHFRRLSEVTSQQIFELGYTTADDLTRLYQDRLICRDILLHMGRSWSSAVTAFGIGAMRQR